MIRDELLTLPLALWSRLRLEGLFFSLQVNAQDPDVWRFRFAPRAELDVNINGNWEWRGISGRAEGVVVPLVKEVEAWLAQERGLQAWPVSPRPERARRGRPPPFG